MVTMPARASPSASRGGLVSSRQEARLDSRSSQALTRPSQDKRLSGTEDAQSNDHCGSYFKKPCGSAPISRPPWSGGGGAGRAARGMSRMSRLFRACRRGGGKKLKVRVVSYNLYWWNAFGQNPWSLAADATGSLLTAADIPLHGSFAQEERPHHSEHQEQAEARFHRPTGDVHSRHSRRERWRSRNCMQECDEPHTIRDRAGLERASKFDGAQGIMVKPGRSPALSAQYLRSLRFLCSLRAERRLQERRLGVQRHSGRAGQLLRFSRLVTPQPGHREMGSPLRDLGGVDRPEKRSDFLALQHPLVPFTAVGTGPAGCFSPSGRSGVYTTATAGFAMKRFDMVAQNTC